MATNPSSYIFNHTMIRVKDPVKSVQFYTEYLGMKLLTKIDMEFGKFTLYFLAYHPEELPASDEERQKIAFGTPGVLELTHNWGTETQEGTPYHNGNSEPRGFGHLAIAVDDVDAACARFESLGIAFAKKPNEGKMRGIAFLKDPDGYWVEVVKRGAPAPTVTLS